MRGRHMTGYWYRDEKTAEATAGGWLRSGDLGLMDADGFITMRGRRSELLVIDGRDWFPRDVEEALATLDGVSMAALVGAGSGETVRPFAFVTALSGASLDPSHMKEGVKGKVPYDLSKLEIRAVPELPMTPTGKVAKAMLAASLAWTSSPEAKDYLDVEGAVAGPLGGAAQRHPRPFLR